MSTFLQKVHIEDLKLEAFSAERYDFDPEPKRQHFQVKYIKLMQTWMLIT
jgi:hypothetical protein